MIPSFFIPGPKDREVRIIQFIDPTLDEGVVRFDWFSKGRDGQVIQMNVPVKAGQERKAKNAIIQWQERQRRLKRSSKILPWPTTDGYIPGYGVRFSSLEAIR